MPGNFESLNSLDFLRGYANGDQVNGEQDRFKETSDIVTDMAENRIEGITQDEARSLGETIRDFFSNKGSMDEFRKKNAAKIEADKKLIGNILNSTPAGQIRKFITKSIIKNYGPQFLDQAENFFKNILPLEDKSVPAPVQWSESLDNQAYSKGAFTNEDYLSAGAKEGTGFSNIRAYLNMLPQSQEIKTSDLLGELRRLGTEKYTDTPFGKFYSPAELKESGFEFSLLKMINQDPNAAMAPADYLKMLNSTDPKTSYQGFKSNISSQDALLQNYRVGLENLEAQSGGTKEFATAKFQMTQALEDQFKNLNSILRNIPNDEDKAQAVGKMIGDIGRPIYDQIKKNYSRLLRLDNTKMIPGRKREIAYLETQNQELNALLSVVRSMAENTGFDTPVQAYLSAGQSSYTMGGGRNYQVKGLTFESRDVPGFSERISGSTHFSQNFGKTDSFHVRSADYKDISGQDVTIIQEVQSDQEEPRRKNKSVQDPSADIKIGRLENEIQDYTANSVLPEMNKRNINPEVLSQIENLYDRMMSDFSDQVSQSKGQITNLPSFDKYVNQYLTEQASLGNITKERKDEVYRFYKRIKPLYSLKNQLYNVQKKSGGDYSALVPFASNPQTYAEQALWRTSLDSLERGINYLAWTPGEVQTQIQHGGHNNADYSVPEEILAAHPRQGQGHFNFYGSAKNPENNTMYKAAQNVIKKYDNLASILGWDNYESPVLFAQGNQFLNLQGDQFGSGNQYDNQPMLSKNQTKGKVPALKEGYAFIDFSPMINSLSDSQKQQLRTLDEEGKLPSYKQGGQVGSPSLVSLEEVINGNR